MLISIHFDPKPNHFARKNLFFPREASGAAAAGGAFTGDGLGFAANWV